jgi:hypothetical protein
MQQRAARDDDRDHDRHGRIDHTRVTTVHRRESTVEPAIRHTPTGVSNTPQTMLTRDTAGTMMAMQANPTSQAGHAAQPTLTEAVVEVRD